MTPPERTALVLTTPAAASRQSNGATLRRDEVVALLERAGHRPVITTPDELHRAVPAHLAVAVSYACAASVRRLRALAGRVWLDAVDSWLLVNGSGLRSGRPSYLARGLRDGGRLVLMPRPDLVTYISRADLEQDRNTVRAGRRLVLPGSQVATPPVGPDDGGGRVVLAGEWDYAPNRDGLRWFAARVLPELERRRPGSTAAVHVFGAGDASAAAGCRVRGYADDPADLYRVGDVHAAPVRFGGGVKRKVLQPLLAGLPVVTTPAGAHGLRAHPRLDVRADAVGFAAALAARLQEPPGVQPVPPAELLDHDDTAEVLAWLGA